MAENNDVHIVEALTGSEARRRAAWELEQVRRLVAQQRAHEADVEARRVFEVEAAAVRRESAARLAALIEWLEPWVDGTNGDVTASMAAVYVQAVTRLDGLYRGVRRPVTPLPVLPEPPVPVVPDVEAERVAAVEAAAVLRAVVGEQLAATRRRMVEAGGVDSMVRDAG